MEMEYEFAWLLSVFAEWIIALNAGEERTNEQQREMLSGIDDGIEIIRGRGRNCPALHSVNNSSLRSLILNKREIIQKMAQRVEYVDWSTLSRERDEICILLSLSFNWKVPWLNRILLKIDAVEFWLRNVSSLISSAREREMFHHSLTFAKGKQRSIADSLNNDGRKESVCPTKRHTSEHCQQRRV